MCGRFTLKTPVADWLSSLFPDQDLVAKVFWEGELPLEPRYNIAPSQDILVMYSTREGELRIAAMRWGLVPFWADSLQSSYTMINARSETLLEKSSFKSLVPTNRCAILADGYYEWKTLGPRQKIPYWIHRPNEVPFGMAGLWTRNKKVLPKASPQPSLKREPSRQGADDHERSASELWSTTIITVPGNEDVQSVHDRMPAMLFRGEEVLRWVLPTDLDVETFVAERLRSANGHQLMVREVRTTVNSALNQGADLIRPKPIC